MTVVDVVDRLDPALHHLALARVELSADVLESVRESLNQRRRDTARTLDTAGVSIEHAKAGNVRVRVYRGGPSPAPAVIYCHSGAFVLGNLDTDHRQCVELARRGQCTVISVDYRLAPEHPFPAALDDVIAALEWAADNGTELQIDTSRLAVAGSSAGAALAARLAQRAADGSAPAIVFQLLHQPVLDDRPTPSKEEFDTTPGFDGPATMLMWQHYLAGEPVPADAAPARAHRVGRCGTHVDHLFRAGSASRRGGRLRLAAHVGGRCHRAARVPGHLPRIRFAPARLGCEPTAVRSSGLVASAGTT